MYISRLIIRNFRNFDTLDVSFKEGVTCIVGENNTGKSNLFYAIRLVVDSNLSWAARRLSEGDVHSETTLTTANQILVSVELKGWAERDHERALVAAWEIAEDTARLTYRFRPKQTIREDIAGGVQDGTNLSAEDYDAEVTGGGVGDPLTISWEEDLGQSIRFGDLQAFQVFSLPALRDVEQDLRNSRFSPLSKLISASDIPLDDKSKLVDILRKANDDISKQKTFKDVGSAIDTAFLDTAGEAFAMNVKLGMADPSFAAITKSLTVLLTNDSLQDFEPSRNGLGLNNMLYISMLIEYFQRRLAAPKKAAGELLLIEEPEAHLHPQLQRTLYGVLAKKDFQTIITTHSTYITSASPITKMVVLTNTGEPASSACVPAVGAELEKEEVADLERYLDATKSSLLFARKVMLVEGPAELFVIPALVKAVKASRGEDFDFDRLGISVIPIYGVHFDVYAKMFGEHGIRKKCAIVTDGDLKPSDVKELATDDGTLDEGEQYDTPDLDDLKNDYVEVFQCPTTFERAITHHGTLNMLAAAADEAGIASAAKVLRKAFDTINIEKPKDEALAKALEPSRKKVLATAKRVGKARFAQLVAKHVDKATVLPSYISRAVDWLVSDE